MESVEKVSVGCQTEPNLIDKLIDNHVRKQLDDGDLYQEYVRSAQSAQFWPLDKNPIRSLVPSMLKFDLPEQHLKNESLMFDLVQAITNNSKLVNLLAKYIHHIVPNVIISKRIDLIPLITCTIRVCRDTNEQERLISLLFNLIKRPNEEQRRMILSGMIVVLQVSPHQSSSLLLPNLWDHVNDKFPERRILLAESCATLAHYVRPIMRTNLVSSILIQLLKDKNAAVRSAACKSFACLLTLIMDRNDEVFDACLSATEDIIQDVLQQTPMNFCEHRYELEQMRFCALETVYPLLCMWAVKLNRFKVELAEFYLAKAERYFAGLLLGQAANHVLLLSAQSSSCSSTGSLSSSPTTTTTGGVAITTATNNQQHQLNLTHLSSSSSLATSVTTDPSQFGSTATTNGLQNATKLTAAAAAAEAIAKRRSVFFESRSSSIAGSANSFNSQSSTASSSSGFFGARRQSAFVGSTTAASSNQAADSSSSQAANNGAMQTSQRAIGAYLKMVNYLVPFVFSDAVHSCAWLSKSNLQQIHQPGTAITTSSSNSSNSNANSNNSDTTTAATTTNTNSPSVKVAADSSPTMAASAGQHQVLFDRPLNFGNKLLDPSLIIDESAIVAFHDQLEQEHMIESLDWILKTFLPRFLAIVSHLSHKKFYSSIGCTADVMQEFLFSSISSTRQLCLLFGRHLTRSKIRPLIKSFLTTNKAPTLFSIYIASLTSFEPIEQQEFEEIVVTIRQNLSLQELTRNDVEILAISMKIIATNKEQIHSPSTRQKFLTYMLDALVSYSNQAIRSSDSSSTSSLVNNQGNNKSNITSSTKSKIAAAIKTASKSNSQSSIDQQQQTQTKEFMLIIFRHILTCLIDQAVRPPDWAHILVTKFLPLLISLANDSTDVYICTYARLMCAQLVETFDTYLNSPKLTKQTADSMLPALASLKGLTEQIKASNLKRQIECLTHDLNEKFFKDENNNNNNNNNDTNNSNGIVLNNHHQ